MFEVCANFHTSCDLGRLTADLCIHPHQRARIVLRVRQYFPHHGTYGSVTALEKRLKVQRTTHCRVPLPTGTSMEQFLHLRQRKHHRRRLKKCKLLKPMTSAIRQCLIYMTRKPMKSQHYCGVKMTIPMTKAVDLSM